MYALTIKEPWLSCILFHGKRIENRTWGAEKVIGQRIYLHTSKQLDTVAARRNASRCAQADLNTGDLLPLGHIVGTAVIRAFVTYDQCPPAQKIWHADRIGWALSDVRRLTVTAPYPGKLGLWTVPTEIEGAVGYGEVVRFFPPTRRRTL